MKKSFFPSKYWGRDSPRLKSESMSFSFEMPDWPSLHSAGRKAKCALFEWLHAVYLLCKRLGITLVAIVVVVGFPMRSFIAEGTNAGIMTASAIGFFSGIWQAVQAGPTIAASAVFAIGIPCWWLYKLFYVPKSKVPEIMNNHRDYMDLYEHEFKTFVEPLHGNSLTQDQINLVTTKVNDLLGKLCLRLECSFKELTGGECCASIKIYNQADGTISTIIRGYDQSYNRKGADNTLPTFPYKRNSAFAKIIDRPVIIDRKDNYYFSNWLQFWRICCLYRNDNQNWLHCYTATVVLPIYDGNNSDARIIGFVCVDNRNGRFQRSLSRSVLNSYEGAARNLLRVLGQEHQNRE